ncbi:hypothetical protein [Spongiactinospora gelatinilytica]|uniref:hypothetical protein n=1 Tax=Spongiactinospora gelatinilytica TaxID=2666298 RepID=UPI001F28EC3F|nr:hypothetical protein [Spongiactinospora gelatinilytica]
MVRRRLVREEWAHLVAECRPELNDPETRAMVDGVQAIIYGLSSAEAQSMVLDVLFPRRHTGTCSCS